MTLPHACPDRDSGRAVRGCPDLGEESSGSHQDHVSAEVAQKREERKPAGLARSESSSGKVPPCRCFIPQAQEKSCTGSSFQGVGALAEGVTEKGVFLLYGEVRRDAFKFQFFCQQTGGKATAWEKSCVLPWSGSAGGLPRLHKLSSESLGRDHFRESQGQLMRR